MIPRPRTLSGIHLVCGAVVFLAAGRSGANPPSTANGPVPGYYLGEESRGYPYYPGYRYYPGYPLYRGYPDYFGYPCYPRDGFAAGYQPQHPYILEFFGLHPAIWRFTDYYSGTFPSYYAGNAPEFRGAIPGPPPQGWDLPYPGGPALFSPPPVSRPPSNAHPHRDAVEVSDSHPAEESAPAGITVRAPAGAAISFDGWKTTLNGPAREFSTAPLQQGNVYAYDITATWQENGQPVTKTKQVLVTAGARLEVVFQAEPRTPAEWLPTPHAPSVNSIVTGAAMTFVPWNR